MISLFIDTSMTNVSISIVKDGKILSIIQKIGKETKLYNVRNNIRYTKRERYT